MRTSTCPSGTACLLLPGLSLPPVGVGGQPHGRKPTQSRASASPCLRDLDTGEECGRRLQITPPFGAPLLFASCSDGGHRFGGGEQRGRAPPGTSYQGRVTPP